jgi:hypothetical protein
MGVTLTQKQLEAAHAWDPSDLVPRRMSEFRQRLRLHQSRWREAHGHPIGTQPIAPRPKDKSVRLVGSRLPLDYARETGANFLTDGALAAARARTSMIERHQTFDHQRLWADLLWSPTLAFNLFGDLATDLDRADRAVHTWWPDAPGTVTEVRFAHSPGRLNPAYMNSLREFDAAFVLDGGGGKQAVVGVDVEYHEAAKSETPKPTNLRRYVELAELSRAFRPGAIDQVKGTSPLAVMWLEHLLLQSMLQHESGSWTWGRYVVIYPAGNADFVEACARYRDLLADESTIGSMTLEAVLDADVLAAPTAAALRERYLPA